jgi:hypothetical protein
LNFTLVAQSIASAFASGASRLVLYLLPSGIGSAEAVGSPTLHLRLLLSGIVSAFASGLHAIVGGVVPLINFIPVLFRRRRR